MTDPQRAVAGDQETFTYDAFISYSHAADGKLAPALQNALQRFAKPWYRRRALHLFCDQTSLSASPGLWPSIEAALTTSRYFLLLASPEAAQSRWVQQDVAWWLEHQSPDTLLIGLTDGHIKRPEGAKDFDWEQTDALPPNLQGVFTENPLWVDFRWAQGQEHLSTKNPAFQNALAALAAPLRGIPKEDLIGEDVRQHRRALLLAQGAAVVLVVLLVAAIGATFLALRNQAEAEKQARISLTRALAAQAVTETERGEHERGALLARQAYLVDEANHGLVRERVNAALRTALGVPYFSPSLRGHGGQVFAVALAPDGRLALGGAADGTVHLWDPAHPEADPAVLPGHEDLVQSVAFTPDGLTLASGGYNGVRLWDLTNLADPVLLRGHERVVESVAFAADGRLLASGSEDRTVRLWDLTNLEADPVVFRGHEGDVLSVAFAPDGHTLASGSYDGTMRLWDLTNPKATPVVLETHMGRVWSVAFAPDGRTLASGGGDGTVRLWDLAHPEAGSTILAEHERPVIAIAFAPDGRLLASGGEDGTVRLWDPAHPEAGSSILVGHEGSVAAVAFAPDGSTLASVGDDHTVRLWDPTHPEAAPVVLVGHEEMVWSLAFAPDGQTLASGSRDGSVWLWIANTETLAKLVCTRVWRNLTLDEWRQFVGDPEQVPYQATCPNLPSGGDMAMATPAIGTLAGPSASPSPG
jgi:WD40 repeat protein